MGWWRPRRRHGGLWPTTVTVTVTVTPTRIVLIATKPTVAVAAAKDHDDSEGGVVALVVLPRVRAWVQAWVRVRLMALQVQLPGPPGPLEPLATHRDPLWFQSQCKWTPWLENTCVKSVTQTSPST